MEFGLKLILKLIHRHRVTNLLEMSILYCLYLLDRSVLYAKCSNRSTEGHSFKLLELLNGVEFWFEIFRIYFWIVLLFFNFF